MRKARQTNDEVVAQLVATVIAKIESGTAGEWRKPWASLTTSGLPFNAVTGRRYSGINVLILALSDHQALSGDARWMTYRQAQGKGWQVRKGERGTRILLCKRIEVADADNDTDDKKTVIMFRTFTVFHAGQIDGMPDRVAAAAPGPERHALAEQLITRTGAQIAYAGGRAFYSPATDRITIPPHNAFTTADGYYATVLHELAHWTGGAHVRVPRTVDATGGFGSEGYAREEVRAEIAAALVLTELGITTAEEATDCHAYIANWVEVLRSEPREIIRAMGDAQAIADYLLCCAPGHTPDAQALNDARAAA